MIFVQQNLCKCSVSQVEYVGTFFDGLRDTNEKNVFRGNILE